MTFYYKNNYLKIESINIKDLANIYPTPFYVYSTKSIKENYTKLKNKLNKNIFYSVKANSNQAIISLLSKLGAGVDVVSGEELQRVLSAKIKSNKIIFEGVGKKESDIILAIKNNIKQINIESNEEIELVNKVANSLNCKAKIGIRINPDIDAKTNDKISTGRKTDKFGIHFYDIEKTIRKINNLKNLKFLGLSCHIGSQIFSLKIYEKMFKKIKEAEKKFNNNKLKVKHINLGGGMGFDYQKNKNFKIIDFKKLIDKYFSNSYCEISIEPGRYLLANTGMLITKVVMTKTNKKLNFLIIDAGMNTFIRPALYNSFHNIIPIKKQNKLIDYCVVGPICESSDTFAKKINLPKQYIGDILAIEDVGAYGSTMSSNYNSKTLPAEVIINNNRHYLIRSNQKIKELIKRDIVPDWIKNIN